MRLSLVNSFNIPTKIHVLQLQLYTAKSQYWLHKAGASPEQWQLKKELKKDNFTYEIFNENIK